MNSQHHNDFEKTMRSLSQRNQIWRVFADFCEMAAISLCNAIEHRQDREERYLEIVRSYTPAEIQEIPKLLAITVMALTDLECDFLGEMFMRLDLKSHWHGQFFTPMPICRAMAEMSIHDMDKTIERQGFITVSEPAAGAGAMILALAAAMRAKKFNPQTQMHVTAIDVDATAAHMCYIQLALCGIPAAVYVGNTISMEMRDCFLTPAHHMGLWDHKLKQREAEDNQQKPEESPPAETAEKVA